MTKKFRFNRLFGLRWYQRFDRTFLQILTIVALATIVLIWLVATADYSYLKIKAHEAIRDRYIRFVAQLIIDDKNNSRQNESSLPKPIYDLPVAKSGNPASSKESRAEQRKVWEEKISRNAIFSATNSKNIYDYLPESENTNNFIDNLQIIELRRNDSPGRWQVGGSNNANSPINLNPGQYDRPLTNVFNYLNRRRGEMYINLTEELVQESVVVTGYRDPLEIERVINENESLIEYCFHKGLRNYAGLKGYVKVQFSVSYEGYVIPESIKILGSTLRNKQVEQCIKTYIRRLRNFQRLDESNGIARVVQKFVFD